jgi:heat shock protein HslJ
MPLPLSPRLLAAVLMIGLPPAPARADQIIGRDWQLLAIDGVVVPAGPTLRIEADGTTGGKAPCNAWSARSSADLPALALGPIRATRMACDRLAEEQAFFDALARMTAVDPQGYRTLVLTGADGRSMEFVYDRMNSLTVCTTCPPEG